MSQPSDPNIIDSQKEQQEQQTNRKILSIIFIL